MADPARLLLRERILDCQACELHSTSRGPVPFSGPVPASFAIVGEAPGAEEDKGGAPFLGKSGQLLRGMLEAAGLDATEAFICNTVSCFPDGTPRTASVLACRSNLHAQLDFARAPQILTLGSVALGAFRPDLKMTMAHGQTFSLPDGRTVFATYHPAAALRRSEWHDAMAEDLLRFGKAMAQRSWVGLTVEICAGCRTHEDDMEQIHFDNSGMPWCELCWPTSLEGRPQPEPPRPASLPVEAQPTAPPKKSKPMSKTMLKQGVALVQHMFPGAEVVARGKL